MTWLTKISSKPSLYYTLVEPEEFQEWHFNQAIPASTYFVTNVPSRESVTHGLIIASAELLSNELIKVDNKYKLNQKVATKPKLEMGQIQTPYELMDKYKTMQKTFNDGFEMFKMQCQDRQFFVSAGAEPHLYKVVDSDANKVKLASFGTTKHVREKLQHAKKAVEKEAYTKNGRAYEMEHLRRFDNAMTFMNNRLIPFDSVRIAEVLAISDLQPGEPYEMPWMKCYAEMIPDSSILANKISKMKSYNWVNSFAK